MPATCISTYSNEGPARQARDGMKSNPFWVILPVQRQTKDIPYGFR